jgi:hypothetical protein
METAMKTMLWVNVAVVVWLVVGGATPLAPRATAGDAPAGAQPEKDKADANVRKLFVATEGSDTAGDGSQAKPWKTIQHAADTMKPGDALTVLAGKYDERVRVKTSGREGSPIVYAAEGKVTLKGFTVNASWITIKGFEITDTDDHWKEGVGIYVEGSHCVIEGNYVYFCTEAGIFLMAFDGKETGTADCVVRGNRLYKNPLGIRVCGRNHLIEGNEIWYPIQHHPKSTRNGAADAINFFGSGHVFRKNYIHDLRYGVPEVKDAHIDCFQTWKGTNFEAAHDIVFEQNFCEALTSQATHENGHGFMLASAHHLTIRNNIVLAFAGINTGGGNTHDLTVVNNLFICDPSFLKPNFNHDPRGVGLENSPNATVMNNIFYNQPAHAIYVTGTSKEGLKAGHNLVYRPDGQKPRGSPNPDDLWQVDPQFVDPAKNDFHLREGSPAIDAGAVLAEVKDDYDGHPRPPEAKPDIGPFEYQKGRKAAGDKADPRPPTPR